MPPIKPGPQPVELPVRTEAPASWSDRRRFPRYSLTAPAEVTEIHSKTVVGGRCTDLSAGGCYVDTLNPFLKGTSVRIRVAQEHRSFLTEAVVVFSQSGMGMGLSFTTMAPSEQRKLNEWLQELSCDSVSPAPSSVASVSPPREDASNSLRNVINQLISLLIRKHVLSDQEGTELLRELFR
ncbi:MAG TPA: PilZ domain-containing protein [Candidatus Dormibacteraeota bacterium]|nr:PilZ domain-containing protein [Candidatus Dormibacteraeota bacterium]